MKRFTMRLKGIDVRTALNRDWESLKLVVDQISLNYAKNVDYHISKQMCDLLICGEDHRFKHHPGVDLFALCRAAYRTLVRGRREGGSTIAMQLVRTITGRREYTLARKFSEIRLAIRLTRYVSKEKIPSLYLWVAYYGWRMNNFFQACNRLGIKPDSLTLMDAANLVARIKYPQPKVSGQERARQIEQRCFYLIRRYGKSRTDHGFALATLKWTHLKFQRRYQD